MNEIFAIGALGGSGTRALAKILSSLGYYIGSSLNSRSDNLFFTQIFKNPEWYKTASKEEIYEKLKLFQFYMEHNLTPPKVEFELRESINSYLEEITESNKVRSSWAWKEPNTQIYIEEVLTVFPKLKYIHLLRNGLDMAFSRNKHQLINWGFKYNIHLTGTESDSEMSVKQLDYWIRSTKDVLRKSELFKNRFLLIDHTQLCFQPQIEIDRLLEFMEETVSPEKRKELYALPSIPTSYNRYKDMDISIFREDQINDLKELGYTI